MGQLPRIAVAGTGSAVGKSLVTMGLAVALGKRGMNVACAVIGSRLQQAAILHRLTRRPCATLDPQMLSKAALVETLRICGDGADIVLIDGARGCFDGDGVTPHDPFAGSDGEIIRTTETPALLVTDLSRVTSSLAAVVHGYSTFDRRLSFSGVIGSRTSVLENDSREYFRDLLECFQLPPFVGQLPTLATKVELPTTAFESVNQTALPVQLLMEIGDLVSQHFDLDRIVSIAQSAPAIPNRGEGIGVNRNMVAARFAVSDDPCFALCYQDNLALLRYLGCDLVRFSPLADTELPPDIGGVYLTGGFLDAYATELAANTTMIESIRKFSERGGVVYAEGAGGAFMCRRITPRSGHSFSGVGLLPAEAFVGSGQGGSLEIELGDDSIIGDPGERLRGYETGEWEIGNLEALNVARVHQAFRITRPDGSVLAEGYSPTSQSLITSRLLHFGSNPRVALALAGALAVIPRR